MGIGNDIRPRRVYRPHHFDEKVLATTPEKPVSNVAAVPTYEILDEAPSLDSHPKANHSFDPKMENEFFSSPEPTEMLEAKKVKTKGEGGKLFFWFILFSVLAGIVVTEYYTDFMKINKKSNTDSASTTKSDTVYSGEVVTQDYVASTSTGETATSTGQTASTGTTSTATATTGSTVAASSVSIKVLNGNGIRNSAAGVKTTLTAAGFTVGTVTNASRFTYTKTYIYYQVGKLAEAQLVQKALAGRDMILQESNTIAGNFNVVVVVGKN